MEHDEKVVIVESLVLMTREIRTLERQVVALWAVFLANTPDSARLEAELASTEQRLREDGPEEEAIRNIETVLEALKAGKKFDEPDA